MVLELPLPPELEARLRGEAERQGLSPVAVALRVLDQNLPATNRAAQLGALLAGWQSEDEAAPDDNSNYDFFQALDAARTSHRKLFPPELKGISW